MSELKKVNDIDHVDSVDLDEKEHPLSRKLSVAAQGHSQGNEEFYAVTQGAKIDPWSWTSIKLYLLLIMAALNATSSGFDGSVFSSINAMKQWQGFLHTEEASAGTSVIMMIYTVGNIVGSCFTGPICDRFGRRGGMMFGSVFILIGAAIVTAVQSKAMMIGGRFVLGFGVSIGTSAAPTYALELAPPHWRARVGGYYNSFFYTGSILCTGVAYASAKMKGEIAFRLPLGLQMIPPIIIFTGCIFAPESPRWLCYMGRHEEASKILAQYHGGGDINHPLVQMEIREFEESIEVQKASKPWDYSGLWENHNARWRTLEMTFMSYFAQLSGNSALTYYLPYMYLQLGIKSTDRRLLLTFANSIVSATGAIAGSATNDRIGRRTKLWVGSIVLSCLFAAVCGFSSQFVDPNVIHSATLSNAGVAFIFLFGCVYSFVYTPLTATYCVEVLKTEARAKGMGVHVIMSNTANLYNTYVTGIAIKAIHWKYYLVFVSLNLVYAVVWYFFGVETRGRTLEQMEEVFDAPFPPKASLRMSKKHDAVVDQESQ